MDGKVLKERLNKLTSLSQMEIAERIGVSAQSLAQYYLAKDVKSGLIEKLCEILDVDIATFYGQEPATSISHNQGDVITGDNVNNRNNDICTQVISVLDNQLKVKDEQIGKLIDLINK